MINKNVKILSLAFLFIFLAYDGVQQYTTAFFSNLGNEEIGFKILLCVYSFFMMGSLVSPLLVFKFGAKKCLIFSSVFYSIFIFSLLSKSVFVIYPAAIFVGLAAAILWVAQTSYLINFSEEKFYGKNSGFFTMFFYIGATTGILIFGWLLKVSSFEVAIFLFGIFSILAIPFILKLPNFNFQRAYSFRAFRNVFFNSTALKVSSIWFVSRLVLGLIIGFLPLEIKKSLGVSYIGVLTIPYYILPLIFSYCFGAISDKFGRNRMVLLFYILAIFSLLALYFSQTVSILIVGIVLLAFAYAVIRPITTALLGDISTKENLEIVTALSYFASTAGVAVSLFIPLLIKTKMVYLASLGALSLSLLILIPLLKLDIGKIKEKINHQFLI